MQHFFKVLIQDDKLTMAPFSVSSHQTVGKWDEAGIQEYGLSKVEETTDWSILFCIEKIWSYGGHAKTLSLLGEVLSWDRVIVCGESNSETELTSICNTWVDIACTLNIEDVFVHHEA